jgi:hypothetical protein
MRKIEIEVYKIDELPEAIRQKVIDNNRYSNVDWEYWNESLLEQWTEKLESLGYNNPKIRYSGFNSQGDGASFTCDASNINGVEFKLLHNHSRYCHEYTVYTEIISDDESITTAMEEDILSTARELMREIYKDLETEYEYQTSDKVILESLRINDCEFLSNGRQYI